MSSPIGTPPINELINPNTVDKKTAAGRLTSSWITYFSNITKVAQAVSSSGTTAQRPIKDIYIGMTYFDTTLNKPIWVKTYTAGAAVWIDATGSVV